MLLKMHLLFTSQAGLIGIALAIVYLISRRIRRRSIAHLPGPDSNSWLVGHLPDFQRPEGAGDADFAWTEKYGLAFRTKGCFGENHLCLTDPKALQHVLNKRGYNYPKPHEFRNIEQLLAGRGLFWADGEQHTRHRKIMNPAFSYPALKGFVPLFFETTQKTTAAWKAILHQQDQRSSVIDVSSWLARTTLDIIGTTAFGYNFNAVEGEETELSKSYHNLFTDANYMISNFTIIFRRLTGFAPLWLTKYLLYLPKKDIRRLRRCDTLVKNMGKQLLAEQHKLYEGGKEGGKDVMSLFSQQADRFIYRFSEVDYILVKANFSEDPTRRLGNDEVLAQISTLTIAGHETTANTLSWILYELSKHPGVQNNLRDEIKATRKKAIARGDKEITIADLESMKFTVAVMKESLRFHPILLQASRMAGCDDVIPLERPQRTVSGEEVIAIPVSQGQIVTISLCAYNRLKSIWGEDADQWSPARFLEELPNGHDHKINLGVFGNLATFSSGLRNCIGWRFALLEMQAILVELVEKFEFSPPPGNVEIRRAMAFLMQPMVKGQESKGTQMPLTVTAIDDI